MKRNIYTVLTIVSIVLTLSGCATFVTIQRTVPAKYPIEGVKKIIFVPYTYEATYHKDASTKLPQILAEQVSADGFFEVGDMPEVPLKIDEKFSASRLKSLGARARVDAVMAGKVMAYQVDVQQREIPVEKEVETGKYKMEQYEENGETKTRLVPIVETATVYEPEIQKAAEVSFYADLFSVKNGKILAHEYFTKIGTEKAQGKNDIEKISSDDKMLLGVTLTLAKSFILAMTPHDIKQKTPLKNDAPCKDGIKKAKKGALSDAFEAWTGALANDPSAHCAAYNLGVCKEHQNKLSEALAYYEKAAAISPNEKLYDGAVKRMKVAIDGESTLKRQLKGRD